MQFVVPCQMQASWFEWPWLLTKKKKESLCEFPEIGEIKALGYEGLRQDWATFPLLESVYLRLIFIYFYLALG